ncbi:hypothetical protein JB92DRAFT_3125604 [Gautieria morchelliformis]|nr:hypothetical protein JB92DRAFT_3125604 [Gautieria morchelliformis]
MAALLNDSIDPALSPELAFFPAPRLVQSDLTPDALKTDLHLTQPSQIELYSSFASGSSQVNHFTEVANSNAATVHDVRICVSSLFSALNPARFVLQPTLQLNSVLGLASRDQLIAARNACILSLESKLKGIKDSYLLLLVKIQEPRFNSPSTKIANCSDEENVMTAQLNRSDYPNVPYWTRSDWDLRANSSVGMPEDDTNANNDSLPCKSMAFITTRDGAPTTNAQARAIRKTERHVWSELVKTRTDPVSWAKAPIYTLDFYRDEMYKHHPDLQLCEGHWKADLLAILDYPSWHRNLKNSSIPLKVKVEQPLTSQPVAPPSTMPSKKRHVSSLHGPCKKKKQNDGEATNLAPGTEPEPSSQPLVTKILGDSTNKRTPIIVDSLVHSEPAEPGSIAPDPAPSTTPPDAGDSLMTDHSIGSPAPPTPGLGDFVVADIPVNVQFTVLSPTPEAKPLAAPSVPILEGSISTEEATKLSPALTAASPDASILAIHNPFELRNGASLPITDILPKMVQATSAVAASTGVKSLKRAYFYPEKNKNNSPFNLFAIDYCHTHSKLFKESVQQAYDALCQDLKMHYMELSTYNKLNKLKPQTSIGPAGPITPISHCVPNVASLAPILPTHVELVRLKLGKKTISSRVGQDRQSIQGNMASTHAPGPNTPQSELENIRTNTLKATWTVTCEVRLSTNPKAVSRELGSGSLTFNGDQTMPEVLESLVYQITPQWTKRLGHLYELHPDDCEIQFRDNKTLKKDTETLSIQKLYEFYSRGADRAFYLTDHRGTAKLPKGSYLCLEVFINVQKYLARTGEGGNEDFGLQVSMPQRGQKSGPGGARGGYKARFVSAPATKRTRGSSIHRSDFIDHDLKAILPMKCYVSRFPLSRNWKGQRLQLVGCAPNELSS